MNRPKLKIGQKATLPNGHEGIVLATRAYQRDTYLGHFSATEYFGRKWSFEHTVAYEDDRGTIRTEKLQEKTP